MKKSYLPLIASALFFTASALHANTVVFSENFDETTPNLDVTTAGQFTALNGTNVDLVAASNGWASLVVAPESGTVVDLGGSGGNPYGDIEAAITVTGGTYVLGFDLVGNQRTSGPDTTQVTITSGSGNTGSSYYNQSFTVAGNGAAGVGGVVTSSSLTLGAGTYYLDFNNLDASLYGYGYDYNISSLLDNVTLTQESVGVVPEPSTFVLFGAGFLGLAFLAFRNARSASALL